jgi:hypothetical protein
VLGRWRRRGFLSRPWFFTTRSARDVGKPVWTGRRPPARAGWRREAAEGGALQRAGWHRRRACIGRVFGEAERRGEETAFGGFKENFQLQTIGV